MRLRARTHTGYTIATWPIYNGFSDLGISQSGSSGSYNYSVIGGDFQAADCPIFDVSWGDAARFCNWLKTGSHRGRGAGHNGDGSIHAQRAITPITDGDSQRRGNILHPSENEWYKAAYYRGGGTKAGYWPYPTQSYTAPVNVLSSTGTNNANFYDYTGPG